jgi:hypothetical protein
MIYSVLMQDIVILTIEIVEFQIKTEITTILSPSL